MTEGKVVDKLVEPTPNNGTEPQSAEKISGLPRLDLTHHLATPEALQLVPEALARKYNIVPLMVDGDKFEIAMADPSNILAIEALATRSKKRIEVVSASVTDILEAIDFNYKRETNEIKGGGNLHFYGIEENVITGLDSTLSNKAETQPAEKPSGIEEKVITGLDSALSSETETQPAEKPSILPGLNLIRLLPTPEALQLVPEALARKYKVIPLMVDSDKLEVAMADPSNILTIEALAAWSKKRIEAVSASVTDILEAIDFNYQAFGEIKQQLDNVVAKPGVSTQKIIAEAADDAPLTRALNSIIEEAVKSRSSDIHLEPDETKLRVRYRIDGTLHDVLSLPMSVHPSLLSRIKIMGSMNIADYRRPQDGQISLNVMDREVDIRVATAYTVNGEMAVLRLLDKSLAVFSLPELGFLSESQERYERMLLSPYGMILVSGPTGAGKTTTLYASVNSLDRVGQHIITIEDPVEYRFEGMNQIQINPRAGLTFATGLRSIVRLDPDVILVGEIRDGDTTQIAVQAALTGHLVLSSVHANDSTGALFRLIDLGAEPFLICSAVIGIVAQRMVRRVCPHCARSTTVSLVEQTAYQKIVGEEQKEFLVGAGCKACTYTGYRGRIGIFEILLMTDEIRQLVMSGVAASRVRARAIEQGMVPLAKDGMLKAKAGITTPSEVIRNAYSTD